MVLLLAWRHGIYIIYLLPGPAITLCVGAAVHHLHALTDLTPNLIHYFLPCITGLYGEIDSVYSIISIAWLSSY